MTVVTTHKNGVGQKFRFFTGSVKAYKRTAADGITEEMVIEGIASSNQRDRYGDTMTAQCQASMLMQSKKLTMFGNHSYGVPEDVYGKCGSSTLETEGDTIKLAIVMVIAQSNPRGVKSWELINKDGVTLAFSIGGIITDAEIDEENDDGSSWWPPLLINDLELLEISLVGIPANRESYTRSFIEDIKKSAFKGATRDPGVQKAFLRSIGVKGIEDEFPDLRDIAPVALSGGGITLVKSGDENKQLQTAVRCLHDPACASFEAHIEKEPGNAVPDEQCAHKNGCQKTKASDSSLCEEHRDAAKIVLDEANAQLATVQASIETANANLSAINAEIEAKTTEKSTLETQAADLVKQIADLDEKKKASELRATPTGRQTKATTAGSSTNKPLSEMTDAELRAHHQALNKSAAVDARPLGADVEREQAH